MNYEVMRLSWEEISPVDYKNLISSIPQSIKTVITS